ncbi:MAG: penicillin-binding transpeptidase domain-containing protein [Flavobacteriales bacterium]
MRSMILVIAAVLLGACGEQHIPIAVKEGPEQVQELDTLARWFREQRVSGSIVVHDLGQDRWIYVDRAAADVATLPASTFKIFSSLYALEEGVVTGPDHLFRFPGGHFGRTEVERDLTLKEAYQRSAYWYHRDIARKAGAARLKHWLDTVAYGNADTSGGFDRCWVNGGLRITPHQQLRFLERLIAEDLPFSQRTMAVVKDIMIERDTLGHVIRAKTGWAITDTTDIGWYVGWVEVKSGGGPYVFATRLFTTDPKHPTFGAARRTITMELLHELGAWP